MLEFCVVDKTLFFNKKMYFKKDGVAMGRSLGPFSLTSTRLISRELICMATNTRRITIENMLTTPVYFETKKMLQSSTILTAIFAPPSSLIGKKKKMASSFFSTPSSEEQMVLPPPFRLDPSPKTKDYSTTFRPYSTTFVPDETINQNQCYIHTGLSRIQNRFEHEHLSC